MRFAVPQFIDVEDKLFGPLTLRQAVYLAGGGGAGFVFFVWFGLFFSVVIGVPIVFLSLALAFIKVNQRPFSHMVYSFVFYMMRNKLYLWKHVAPKQETATTDTVGRARTSAPLVTPQLTQSRLKELAWSLDTKESMYANEDQWK